MTYVETDDGVLLSEPCDPMQPAKLDTLHVYCDPDWYSRCECGCHAAEEDE